MSPASKKPKVEILTAGDALKPQPPIDWIVRDLIAKGNLIMFFGDAGSKKTFSLIDLIVCVASGTKWLTFDTVQCNVLYIDEDNGKHRMLRRLGESLNAHNADQNTPVHVISLAGFDLGQDDWEMELTQQIIVTNSKLVVIDAFVNVMPGRDENNTKETFPILKKLRRIAEITRAAIILVHHENKTGGYRGSTAIKGVLDLLIQVESEAKQELITFKSIKTRDIEPINFAARIEFMNAIDPNMFWLTSTATPTKNKSYPKGQTYVLRYLFANGTSSMEDIKNNADPAICKPRTAENAVGDLIIAGLVERANAGGRGVIAEYKLTQLGNDEAKNL